MAAGLSSHDGDGQLTGKKRCLEVQIEDFSYDGLRSIFNGSNEAESRVVDKNIDTSITIHGRLNHLLNLLFIPQIQRQQESVAANFRLQFLQAFLAARYQHQSCALAP